MVRQGSGDYQEVDREFQDLSLFHVRKADPKQLVNFIYNEHPRLSLNPCYLEPEQASIVLSDFLRRCRRRSPAGLP